MADGVTAAGGDSNINFDQSLDEMKNVFQQAISNNIEVNKISTEGKTAIEAARTKPLG